MHLEAAKDKEALLLDMRELRQESDQMELELGTAEKNLKDLKQDYRDLKAYTTHTHSHTLSTLSTHKHTHTSCFTLVFAPCLFETPLRRIT